MTCDMDLRTLVMYDLSTTYLVTPHSLKYFFQLYTELLDVVHQDTCL